MLRYQRHTPLREHPLGRPIYSHPIAGDHSRARPATLVWMNHYRNSALLASNLEKSFWLIVLSV
jgi:hypothetical protein